MLNSNLHDFMGAKAPSAAQIVPIQELLLNIRSGIENPFDFCRAKNRAHSYKRVFFDLTCSTSTQIERFQKAPSKMFETPCIYTKSLHINSNIAQFKLTRLPTHLKSLFSRQCQIRSIRY